MRYEFHCEAFDEYEAAAKFYADCREGLGLRFVACVEKAIEQVATAPTRWHLLEHDIRQCAVRVFPYVVLYSIEPEYVLIIAVMHCHQEPYYWRHRV